MSALPLRRQPAGLIHDHLLVQALADDEAVTDLGDRHGSGFVLSGSRALAQAHNLARRIDVPVLCDRRRYAGKARATGTRPFDQRWIDQQRDLGLARVLSDSGYIGRGDTRALESVLDQAADAGPDVVAVLPIHVSWLSVGLKPLVAEIGAHSTPIALVLEHRDDPLGVKINVQGLVTLLRQAAVEVGLLCSDVSALGALAFGATWSAVGVRTSLRHLYPADAGGGRPTGKPSALVDQALALINVEKIAAGWAATPEDPAWICPCSTCHGRTVDWLVHATWHEANAHTFELLLNRRDALVCLPPGWPREQSWRAQCASAAFQYQSLSLAGLAWQVPRFLSHWQAV